MDSPNFEGFHAQLDCIFTYGSKNKKKTDTRIVYIVSCTGKKNTERNSKKQ